MENKIISESRSACAWYMMNISPHSPSYLFINHFSELSFTHFLVAHETSTANLYQDYLRL